MKKAQGKVKEKRKECATFSRYDKEKKQWKKVKISLGDFLEFASLVQSPNFYLNENIIDTVKQSKVLGLYEVRADIDSYLDLINAVFRNSAIIVNISDVLYEEFAWPLRKQRIRNGKDDSWTRYQAVSERANLRKTIYMKLADIACESILETEVKRYCGYSITSFDRACLCNYSDIVLRKMTRLLCHVSNNDGYGFFSAFLPQTEKTWKKLIQILDEQNADAEEMSLQELSRNLDFSHKQTCEEIDESSIVFFKKLDNAIHMATNCSEDEKESNHVKLVRIYLAIELILDAEKRITVNKLERIIKHLLG